MTTGKSGLEEAFAHSREYLFAICYRLTGDPSEAEDLVQETFARALEKPPPLHSVVVPEKLRFIRDA